MLILSQISLCFFARTPALQRSSTLRPKNQTLSRNPCLPSFAKAANKQKNLDNPYVKLIKLIKMIDKQKKRY